MAVFADSSYFIALADRKDQWHEKARGLLPLVAGRGPVHTHALAVGELVAVVGPSAGGKAVRQAYHSVRDATKIHYPVSSDLDSAMEDVVRFDGGLSLSDAYALLIMRREGIQEIVSFDSDFDGKGVRRLHTPPPGAK